MDAVRPVVVVDAINLHRRAAIIIACMPTHVVGWYVARTERPDAWAALFSRIAALDVVVCDGGGRHCLGPCPAVAHPAPSCSIISTCSDTHPCRVGALTVRFGGHQPRSASRCGAARSETLIPTIASPRPRDASAIA